MPKVGIDRSSAMLAENIPAPNIGLESDADYQEMKREALRIQTAGSPQNHNHRLIFHVAPLSFMPLQKKSRASVLYHLRLPQDIEINTL